MSRYIKVDVDRRLVKETIASMDECWHRINDVCCNDMIERCGYLVNTEYCRKQCPHFQKEDGIITER